MENATKPPPGLSEKQGRTVLLADLQTIHKQLDKQIEDALLGVLRSGRYILGPEVERFESWMARYCGVGHAVGCASGTDALLLALMACGVGPGDEVVTTPFTFFSTASVIARLGARPVFCDIGAGTFHLCPAQLRETLNRNPSVKAVIAVGLFGACPDIDSLRAAVAPEVKLIEDAAQTLGATYKGRPSGSLGDVSCVSFFPTKNLGACGDAGMVLTDSRKTADLIRALRVHGSSEQYIHTHIGINSRLDAIQATILSVKARFLDGWNEARRCNAQMYTRELSALPLELPHPTAEQTRHTYHHYVIRTKHRDSLRAWLESWGIQTGIYYPVPLHLQPCFAYLGYKRGHFPNSERAAGEVLALPVHPTLTMDDVEYVVKAVKSFFAAERREGPSNNGPA